MTRRLRLALQETADCLGGVEFDTVVTAASWAFCRQGEAARRYIVADFWCRGPSELGPQEPIAGTIRSRRSYMCWQPTAMPPSAAALLNKARAGHKGEGRAFSRTQEFVAGLYWFTTLPLETRLGLVHEFMAGLATEDRLKADTTGEARFLSGPWQAATGGSTGGS